MTAYGAFAVGTIVIVTGVIVLSRRTQHVLEPLPSGGARLAEETVSVGGLYLNVLASQLAVAGLLSGLVWWTAVPTGALGVPGEMTWPIAASVGTGLGGCLFLANAGSVRLLDRIGVAYSEAVRGALRPRTRIGWAALLVVVLPGIAVVEEFVFRAALIGAVHDGFGVSHVVLVVASAAAFALGHGMQGPGGVLVTAGFGLVLGGAFVLSGSLLLVIVAHYVVNALEFVVHEGVR